MLDIIKWEKLLKKAKAGDAISQDEVANYYVDGYINSNKKEVVKKNESLAYSWAEKSANQNNVNGVCSLAYFIDNGIGCKTNTLKAIKLYKKATKLGSHESAYNLGITYRDKGNYKKAFEYYKLSMEMQNSNYFFKVGLCYYYGIGVNQNKKTAIQHFKKVSIDKLNIHTQYEIDSANYFIGLSYLTGEGIGKSIKKAKSYFELSNQDNDNQNTLELIHLIGRIKSK